MENICNKTKFRIVSRVNKAVCPVYFTGNTADSTAVHRKPRKKSCPDDRPETVCKSKFVHYNYI